MIVLNTFRKHSQLRTGCVYYTHHRTIQLDDSDETIAGIIMVLDTVARSKCKQCLGRGRQKITNVATGPRQPPARHYVCDCIHKTKGGPDVVNALIERHNELSA